MTVRAVLPEDIAALCTIRRQGWLDAYTGPPIGFSSTELLQSIDFDSAATQAAWRDRLRAEGAICLVAQAASDREPLGYIEARGPTPLGSAEILALYVMRKARGAGLGSTLVQSALNRLGDGPVRVAVAVGNARAVAFYHKVGFLVDGGARPLDRCFHIAGRPLRETVLIRPTALASTR